MSFWGLEKRANKSWGEIALDALGHTGLGLLYAAPALWWFEGHHLAAVLPPLLGGAARELEQFASNGSPNLVDRVLDTLEHIPGGS